MKISSFFFSRIKKETKKSRQNEFFLLLLAWPKRSKSSRLRSFTDSPKLTSLKNLQGLANYY